MPSRLKLLSFALFAAFTVTITSQATELTLTTEQGFELKADYYQPENAEERAVLLLHQCNFNRTMYDYIGRELSISGIHALSLDFRGFGESIDEETDMKKFGRNAIWEYRKHWPKDVQLAYDFLRKKVGKDGIIGVTGASCGGRQAKIVAENNPINAVSFFSSNVVHNDNDDTVADYKAIAKKPTLFITAEEDGTYAGTQRGFALNENINSKFIAYKGKGHGYPLLEQDKHLAETMVDWFDNNLVK
ncbi:MAG: alpha/beta hydrolase [Robiginitomaculum sp.]|nr:MAG: alpha/beta hydrolase [Robiginitomaculum sp.]